jgi:hypothetical protein
MNRQQIVLALALALMLAGHLITRFAPENAMIGHVLVGLGAIGGVIGFSIKP